MENALPIEREARRRDLFAAIFSPKGEHLFSGDQYGVEVWRMQDGEQASVATMQASNVECLAVSKDGKWVAGGTSRGYVHVWDANTHKKVWEKQEDTWDIHAVDFSVDSTRLVSGSRNGTAAVWNVESGEKVKVLKHEGWLSAAKYSPGGGRIATAVLYGSVRVWDGNDGRLLLNIPVEVTPQYNHGLTWFNNNIFVISDDKIKQLDGLTGTTVSQLHVSNADRYSSIAIPSHGKYIAYLSRRTVSLWDTSTWFQLGVVEWPHDIRATALSPDTKSLVVGDASGKINTTTRHLSRGIHVLDGISSHPTLQDIDTEIHPTALGAWKLNNLEDAKAVLTLAILLDAQHQNHHLLAARALLHARLGHSDDALVDANAAIKIQPCIIAFVAESLVHLSRGEKDKAYRTCDIAFEHFHATHVTLILVIKAILVFLAGEHPDAISRMDDLIAVVPSNPLLYTIQAHMHLLSGNKHVERGDYESAVQSFERARAQALDDCQPLPSVIFLMSGWTFDSLQITIRQRLCEALWAAGRKEDAGESFLEMVNNYDKGVHMNKPVTQWASHFTEQYLSESEAIHDLAERSTPEPHPTVISLLGEWAKAKLVHDSWQDALHSSVKFGVSPFTVFRALFERLHTDGRTTDASECFRQMLSEFVDDENVTDEQANWIMEFRVHCCNTLENLADVAMNDGRQDDAVVHYSAALSLDPAAPQSLLVKRSRAFLAKGLHVEALCDANKVAEIDVLSPWGYERKHAALHKAGDYEGAVDAFETMLSRISQSPDEGVRVLRANYVEPANTRAVIKSTVQGAIRDSPRVLIDVNSGNLCDKQQQAASFESLPVFNELISSMTTHIDLAAIQLKVMEYYRYGMLSHKWENNEPLFDQVLHVAVYDLPESPTHDKLKTYCKIIHDAGLHWAWSDTCCINKADHFVLQEALVSMFKWYQNSTLTVVFLFDVRSPSRRGDLTSSIWNSRAWTFQEYHASKVVRFYTGDWKSYLDLDTPNHKESPEIISEMEEATGISARALTAIQPGLDAIRQKLCLASTRKTTLVEDAAYSLLGIFSMPLPIVYGEGDHALGRLLARLLTNSGDTSILAWTGRSGSFNSSLPTNIAMFEQLSPPHIPPALERDAMANISVRLHSSFPDITSIINLYDRIDSLPVASFSDQRMKLPCLVFKLGQVTQSHDRTGSRCMYAASTDMIRTAEIRTEENISVSNPLYIIYPWIDYLLNRNFAAAGFETMTRLEDTDHPLASLSPESLYSTPLTFPFAAPTQTEIAQPVPGIWQLLRGAGTTSLMDAAPELSTNKETRAFQVAARLTQPFGALLLARDPGRVAAYKRVFADALVTVELEEITPATVNRFVSSVHVIDVL